MIVGGNQRKTTLVVGAGLVGAHYIKRILNQERDVLATVHELEKELKTFEQRTGLNNPEGITLGDKLALQYQRGSTNVTLTSLDLFEEDLETILRPLTLDNVNLDQVINAVNLGTLFGLKALKGEIKETDLFDFCLRYHNALVKYTQESGNPLSHLIVSTVGSGGIGLERMRISHNLSESGIPPSIILKHRYAKEIASTFKDFRRSSETVRHKVIVPTSAIIDLEIYEGNVRVYGDYKNLVQGDFIRAVSPTITIDGKVLSETQNLDTLLEARYGLFGEDGPHTVADLQQLQLFMGVTTATKISEIIEDTIKAQGAYNYDLINGGNEVVEQSEYAVHGFERRAANRSEKYIPISLSPIAPFNLTLRCFTYELLADVGLERLEDLKDLSTTKKTIEELVDKVQAILELDPERLIASVSLGVAYDLKSESRRYQAEGSFVRGTINNETIKECIKLVPEFLDFKQKSSKLNDFMATYETNQGILTKDVIGYLAAFPLASQMRKRGHF
ncbi:MAG: hypothetical protein ABIH82_06575 [Candidatus Woesearchaeota archaeon]